jgi:hypothetical protein
MSARVTVLPVIAQPPFGDLDGADRLPAGASQLSNFLDVGEKRPVLNIRPVLGALINMAALVALVVDPMRDEKVAFAELSINVVAWIGVPDEAHDLYKKLTVSPELGVTCLQKRERSMAHPRVF